MLTNILAPKQCTYKYSYTTVQEFVDFCQKLTRFGEFGVYSFLGYLNSREATTLLAQSITTEDHQQMIFRGFEGYFPMPPDSQAYAGDLAINDLMFIAIMDMNPHIAVFNLSTINPPMVAGPTLHQAG
ncbi:hypothetical protein P170DRAFT_480145 [Aspergillus steynii IBT 23096]|uniref:Uncharacterized protein n=1 Tax=Aspergillus steynii IBT 23096 TaxID=1392250 RepID=A0A2I2FUR4_9EURO|nr:uncharacterized protein P170DRAFT_480145 [Aspergillus steynii IBT 23096]PLB44380.1 hypothetical protein P170DRAFT_480145 [Aspergillus steynii IBT 23096]